MDIYESWLIEFRVLVDAEIKAAGGKAADGYRAMASKTGLGYDYIYQIYSGQPKKTPKRPTSDVMNALRRVYETPPSATPPLYSRDALDLAEMLDGVLDVKQRRVLYAQCVLLLSGGFELIVSPTDATPIDAHVPGKQTPAAPRPVKQL